MIRIIHTSQSRGEVLREQITITDDFDIPAIDYCPPRWEVVSDEKHDIDMASGFPIGHTFEKKRL